MTYGATFSQAGAPIERAADFQRVLDTRWKTMSIVATVEIPYRNLFSGDDIQKLYDHNLGYLPAFEAPFFNTRFEQQSTAVGSYAFVADRQSIYFVKFPGASNPDYKIQGYINVYDLNIEEDFDSKSKGTLVATRGGDIGMKIIGNDEFAAKNVQDKGALGYSVTTESKAFGVSKVATTTLTGGTSSPTFTPATAIIEHDLSYPPLIKFVTLSPLGVSFSDASQTNLPKPSASDVFCGPMGLGFSASNLYVQTETNRLIVNGQNGTFRYIIFREPTEIAG